MSKDSSSLIFLALLCATLWHNEYIEFYLKEREYYAHKNRR